MTAISSNRRSVPPVASRRSLTVAQAADGRWIVRDRPRGLERSFATQRAALHFALFEIGNPYATGSVLFIPSVRTGARTDN